MAITQYHTHTEDTAIDYRNLQLRVRQKQKRANPMLDTYSYSSGAGYSITEDRP